MHATSSSYRLLVNSIRAPRRPCATRCLLSKRPARRQPWPVAELSDVLPQLASCDSGASIPSGLMSDQRSRIKPFDGMQRPRFLAAQGAEGKFANTVAQGAIEEVAAAVGKESGIDFESMGSLMQAARAAILQIRATSQ